VILDKEYFRREVADTGEGNNLSYGDKEEYAFLNICVDVICGYFNHHKM